MDAFPKCSVCQQNFTLKGPAPYLLPCLHAVCETCVTSAAGGVISCSTCQREVNLSDTILQKDAVRQKEIFHLTVKHRPTELLCTHDDGNQAVCWCPECEEFLCEYCQNLHNRFKATRIHVVETFTDTTTGSIHTKPVCKLHNPYPLEYFDKNCHILICAKCRLGDHAEHDVGDVNVAADAAKGRISQHGKNMTSYNASHQAYLKSIRQAKNDTRKTSSALKEAIHYTFHSLRTQLDQREKELIIDLENQTKQELSNLHTARLTSQGESERTKRTSDYIKTVLRYASNSDFLTLESSIQDTIKTHLDSVPPEAYSSPAAAFNSRGLDKLNSAISEFGSVVRGESTSDGQMPTDRGTQRDDFYLPADPENTLKHLKLSGAANHPAPLPQFGARSSTYSLETETGTTLTLQSPKLQLDAARANPGRCHVTTDGELINSPPATQHRHSGRLQKYWGTRASTPILLPPPSTTVIPVPHTPRYWETQSRVGVVGGGLEQFVLEMGVVEESQVDSKVYVCAQRRSWCVFVWSCNTHQGLCTRVWQRGERGECYSNTMSDTLGTQATLHYGVVLDVGRGRLAFIDLNREVVLAKVDVEWSESLRPMFGVGRPDDYTVKMKVISGVDITMTDTKKSLIYDALN